MCAARKAHLWRTASPRRDPNVSSAGQARSPGRTAARQQEAVWAERGRVSKQRAARRRNFTHMRRACSQFSDHVLQRPRLARVCAIWSRFRTGDGPLIALLPRVHTNHEYDCMRARVDINNSSIQRHQLMLHDAQPASGMSRTAIADSSRAHLADRRTRLDCSSRALLDSML